MTARRLVDVDVTDRDDGLIPAWDTASGTHKYVEPTIGSAPAFIGCKAYHSTTHATGAADIPLLMDSDEIDTHAFHFTSAAALTGTVTKAATSDQIVGSSTLFTSELSVNQVISIPGTAVEWFVVKSIEDDTHLTTWAAAANSASGQTATRRNEALAIPAGKAGKYSIVGTSFSSGTGAIYIIKNASTKVRGARDISASGTYHNMGAAPVDLAEGDYVRLFCSANTTYGSSSDIHGATSLSLVFEGT